MDEDYEILVDHDEDLDDDYAGQEEGASTSTASDHENDNGGSQSSEDERNQARARADSAEPAAAVDSTTEGEFRLNFGNTVNTETPLCVHTHTPPAYAH